MSELKQMYAQTPLKIEATYDRVAVKEVVVSSPEIGGEVTARATLVLYRNTPLGTEEAPTEPHRLVVENVLVAADADPELKAAVVALMAVIAKVSSASGIVRG